VEASNSCAGTLIFGSFFFIVFCQSFLPFSAPFRFFLFSVLLSFLLLSNWFLFLLSFIFPLLFRHCFIPVSLAHVVSSLAYPNLLGTKRLGCCCCCCIIIFMNWSISLYLAVLSKRTVLSMSSSSLTDESNIRRCRTYLEYKGVLLFRDFDGT
jgi:hypothetical protein